MTAGDDLDPANPRRIATPELMDGPAVDDASLRRALKFIRRVNVLLGYNRLLERALLDLAADLPQKQPLRVLDVATGSADAIVGLPALGEKIGRAIEVIGLDLHAGTLGEARRYTRGAVPLVRGDALSLPFPDGSVDVVMTSMFLHHLSTEQAAAVLREMARVARVGVIAADLLRDRWAYRGITLLTLLSSRMIRHDARLSVRQAFSKVEAAALPAAAGLGHATTTFGSFYRFVISAWKH